MVWYRYQDLPMASFAEPVMNPFTFGIVVDSTFQQGLARFASLTRGGGV